MPIKAKVVLVVLLCLAAVGAIGAHMVRRVSEGDMGIEAERAVHAAARAFADLERADAEKLAAALVALSADPAFVGPFVRRDREALLAAASPTFRELRDRCSVTHWYFLDPEPRRTCFLRVHYSPLHGDVVERSTLSQAIRTRETAWGKELGKTAFALRVVRPWVVEGRLLGYLELGEEIGHFLDRMKAQTGDDFALVVDKRYLDEEEWAAIAARAGQRDTWKDDPTTVVVDATRPGEAALRYQGPVEAIPEGGRVLGTVEQGGAAFVRGLAPVRDVDGRQVGALVVLHDVTAMRRAMDRERLRALALVLAVALAASGLLILLLHRLVFRRLDRMIESMQDLSERLAGGDFEAGRHLATAADDEVGRFERFFGRFLSVIGETLKGLQDPARRG